MKVIYGIIFGLLLVAVTSAMAGAAVGDVDVPLTGTYRIGGIGVLSGGPTGYTPTIGAHDTGTVYVQMSDGETFSVWQGGEWSLYMDGSAASARAAFRGDVKAQVFIAAQPVLRTADFTVGDDENTVLVDPNGSTIVAHLPVATYHRGRRITIKAVGNGRVDIQPALNQMSNIVDTIDGIYSAMLYGAQTGKMAAITLEAFDFDSDDNQSTPEPTGWVIVGGY